MEIGNKKLIFGILALNLLVLLIIGIALLVILKKPEPKKEITNFKECVETGYPISDSYPRQCRTSDGRTFTEEVVLESEPTESGIGIGFILGKETLEFTPYLTSDKDYVDTILGPANIDLVKQMDSEPIKVTCISTSLQQMRNTVALLQREGTKCDYLAYNAEDRPNATPPDEMHPYENYITSVKEAQGIAHGVGAVFVNGPGLGYMEKQPDRGKQLYKEAAPYVDIWMIQSQGYTTVGRTDQHVTPEQYRASVSEIADWIHEGNPNARIWVQIILSGGRLATNPLTAEEVVGYARAVEEIVDNVRVYLRGSEGSFPPPENLEKLRQIIELLRSQGS